METETLKMKNIPFSQENPYAVERCIDFESMIINFMNKRKKIMKKEQINESEYFILVNMIIIGTTTKNKNIKITDIVKKMEISKQQVHKSITHLAELGYVKKKDGPGNQKIVVITTNGEEFCIKYILKMWQIVYNACSSTEILAMTQIVDKMSEVIESELLTSFDLT